jgi:hypothetical protein
MLQAAVMKPMRGNTRALKPMLEVEAGMGDSGQSGCWDSKEGELINYLSIGERIYKYYDLSSEAKFKKYCQCQAIHHYFSSPILCYDLL